MIDHTGITTEAYSYFYNGRGDIIQVINDTGAVVASYDYDPFGFPENATGTLNQNFRFSTKFLDPESGFIYYGYRWYSPETMRWLSMDPLGEAGGLNLYKFVSNDPVNRIDPLGLTDTEWRLDKYDHGGPHFQKGDMRYDAETLEPIKHKGKTPPELSKRTKKQLAKKFGKRLAKMGLRRLWFLGPIFFIIDEVTGDDNEDSSKDLEGEEGGEGGCD